MATLLEQVINQNSRCFACGSLVYAVEKKMTTKHIYHNRCFRCRICKRNLTGYSLNEEGDDIYCANCYRRKQRGDCNSFEFHRAAAERAQYVHNRSHPDHQYSFTNLRSTIGRDSSRHPSLTLRQLERQFILNNNVHNGTINQKKYTDFSIFDPITINTNIYNDSSSIHDDRTREKFNENLNNSEYSKSIVSPTHSTTGTGNIEFRLNKSSIDLTNVMSPRTERKYIIIPDLNQNNEIDEDFDSISIRPRSSSANYLRNFKHTE